MSLLDNLEKQSRARSSSTYRQRGALDAILSLAAERQEAAATAPVANTPSSKALENLTPDKTKAASPVAIQTDRAGNKGGFNPNFNSALSRLLKDFGGKVKVNSGYRSPERQAQLWSQALKKYGSAAAARKWVAPPGKSNHGRGLASDLGYADAATRKLVHARAKEYGLHFPLSNENWHIEPISARKR